MIQWTTGRISRRVHRSCTRVQAHSWHLGRAVRLLWLLSQLSQAKLGQDWESLPEAEGSIGGPPCRLPRGTLGRTGPSPGPVGLMTGAIGLSVWGDVGYNTPEQAGTWGRRAEAEIILVCRLHINSSTTPIQSIFLSVCFSFAFQSSFARSPLGIPSSPMLV